jgi:hypothetical protein
MGWWGERGLNGKRLRGEWGRRWKGSDGEAEGVEEEGAQKGIGLEEEADGGRAIRPGGRRSKVRAEVEIWRGGGGKKGEKIRGGELGWGGVGGGGV